MDIRKSFLPQHRPDSPDYDRTPRRSSGRLPVIAGTLAIIWLLLFFGATAGWSGEAMFMLPFLTLLTGATLCAIAGEDAL